MGVRGNGLGEWGGWSARGFGMMSRVMLCVGSHVQKVLEPPSRSLQVRALPLSASSALVPLLSSEQSNEVALQPRYYGLSLTTAGHLHHNSTAPQSSPPELPPRMSQPLRHRAAVGT
jgi:hypothetical protein